MARFLFECSRAVLAAHVLTVNVAAIAMVPKGSTNFDAMVANFTAFTELHAHHHDLFGAGIGDSHVKSAFLQSHSVAKPKFGKVMRKILFRLGFGLNEEDEKRAIRDFLKERQAANPSSFKCGVTKQITSASDPTEFCPHDCPLFAEELGNKAHCDFQCVGMSTEKCVAMNPAEPVADWDLGICRGCRVNGCEVCVMDGTDTCAACKMGYSLEDGQCYNDSVYIWTGLFSVIVVLIIIIVAWITSLNLRTVVNPTGVQEGLNLRSRAKLHTPPTEGDNGSIERNPYPLLTNLTKTGVAGPGLLLQFNFQAILIIWALCVGLAWRWMALSVDEELLVLGTRTAETAVQNCQLVAYGYEKQREFMWAKVQFMNYVYFISFALAVLHAVRQLRIFQVMDEVDKTHKDFCAVVHGLPEFNGKEKVEDQVTQAIAKHTKEKVIGASVCWNLSEVEDTLMSAIEMDTFMRQADPTHTPRLHNAAKKNSPRVPSKQVGEAEVDGLAEEKGAMRLMAEGLWSKVQGLFQLVEDTFLSPTAQKVLKKGRTSGAARRKEAKEQRQQQEKERLEAEGKPVPDVIEVDEIDVEEVLENMTSCNSAYVVFNTEAARDRAVEMCKTEGFEFQGNPCTLREAHYEPDSVMWQNAHVDQNKKAMKFVKGIGSILFALGIWICAFYIPYTYYALSFSYSYGHEPGIITGITFSMLVVVGNALMYFTCSVVADKIQLMYVDQREAAYMLMYNFACTLNVILDLLTTYFIAYRMMVGVNMRTYDGRPLAEITSFTETFESYAMQKALGDQLMAYSFPATFLIPFMIEGIATIYIPYKLMRLIVGVHPEITGNTAENMMQSTPMDLSRYADLHLNLMLVVLVFYFPGGFTSFLFIAMGLSHCVIYSYDHYRVLRSIPTCNFASMNVDWWATWLMCVPCGLLASCLVFKSNCEGDGLCHHGWFLIAKCTTAFLLHVIVHTLLLVYLVPKLGRAEIEKTESEDEYKECCEKFAYSWFTTNPVYCLRTEYIYSQSPSCDYCMAGKEHMVRQNIKEHRYFMDEAARVEQFASIAEVAKAGWADTKEFTISTYNETKEAAKTRAAAVRRSVSARFSKSEEDAKPKEEAKPADSNDNA